MLAADFSDTTTLHICVMCMLKRACVMCAIFSFRQNEISINPTSTADFSAELLKGYKGMVSQYVYQGFLQV